MNNKFYIGQDVVCIKTHSKGIVKEGEVFTIKALSSCYCRCSNVRVDVGIKIPIRIGALVFCPVCLDTNKLSIADGAWWLDERLFKPLDSLVNIGELTEVLSEPLFS